MAKELSFSDNQGSVNFDYSKGKTAQSQFLFKDEVWDISFAFSTL